MLTTPQIRIVDASAGSGKTYQLTLQYLLLLLSPKSNFENILAITFTNDATNEMKRRILDWLKLLSVGDKDVLKEIRAYDTGGIFRSFSDEKLSKIAAEKIGEILKSYQDFNIQTIDSFINSIASSSLLDAGLPPNYEIVTDTARYIEYVFNEFLSRLKPDFPEAEIFDDFLHTYLTVEKLQGWSPRHSILEMIKLLNDWESITGKHFYLPDYEIGKRKTELKKLLLKFIQSCDNDSLARSLEKKINNDNIESITEKQLKALPSKLKERLEKYFNTLAAARLKSYITIFQSIRNELKNFKNKHGIIFISDLNSRINEYLKHDVVPEVYFMLGEKISHYLIDEFQDTSELQWRNLFCLVENTLASGGTLFYVGDKKQSLYGFRGGDAKLFDVAALDFAVSAKELVQLDKNFRSRRNIVEFNNKIFSAENLQKLTSDERILSFYKNVRQKVARKSGSEGGLVSVKKLSLENSDKLDEALQEYILKVISEIHKKYNYGDIGILVRRNEEARKITQWLLRAGHPVVSEVTMSVRENHLINEIISFLKFLISPTDNLSFVSFIAGEIFITENKSHKISRSEIMNFLEQNRTNPLPLYVVFKERYKEIFEEKIKKYIELAGFMSPYELVSFIFYDYRIFENFSDNEGFFMRLLEILNGTGSVSFNSLEGFLDYWASGNPDDFRIALPDFIDAVNVTTIHKAKGLSYPVVIVPFYCFRKTKNEFVTKNDSLDIKYIKKEYLKFSGELRKIYQQNLQEELLNDLNTLYVALTRAEDELYLLMLETEHSRNSFMVLFDECEITYGHPAPTATKKSCCITDRKLSKKLKAMSLPQKDMDLQIYNYERLDKVRRGEFVHEVLSRIVSLDLLPSLEDIIKSVAFESGYYVDISALKDMISDFLSIKEVQEWFLKKGQNEFQIVDADGSILRIDRIVYDDGISVVEYKTGEQYSDRHAAQVRNYMKNIRAVYPDKKVEGYLAYIDELKIIKVC